MKSVGIALGGAILLTACAPAVQPDLTRDQAVAFCTEEALRRGEPELNEPFGPDGLRANAGLPPFDTTIPRIERETVYQTCFHRVTGQLPADIPPLG